MYNKLIFQYNFFISVLTIYIATYLNNHFSFHKTKRAQLPFSHILELINIHTDSQSASD